MSAEHTEPEAHARGGFEPDRVNLRAYYLTLAAIAGVMLCAIGLTAAFSRLSHGLRQPIVTPVLRAERTPEPHLQVDPAGELQAMLADERARLSSYGILDRERGVVHIPIEVAKRRLLEHGLPLRPDVRAARDAEAP